MAVLRTIYSVVLEQINITTINIPPLQQRHLGRLKRRPEPGRRRSRPDLGLLANSLLTEKRLADQTEERLLQSMLLQEYGLITL